MENVFIKLKQEIIKKIEGYQVSLRNHRENEEKLVKELDKCRRNQDAVFNLTLEAKKELDKLEDYITSRSQIKE